MVDLAPHGTHDLFACASAAFVTAVSPSLSGVRGILRSRAPRGLGSEEAQTVLAESAASWGMGREKRMSSGAARTTTLDCLASGRAALAEQNRPKPMRSALGHQRPRPGARTRARRGLAPQHIDAAPAKSGCHGRPCPQVTRSELLGRLPKLVRARHGRWRIPEARETAASRNADARRADRDVQSGARVSEG